MLAELVVGLVALVLIGLSVRVVPEQANVAVWRLGRFIGIRGPGVVMILPLVDRAIRINLDQEVPRWRFLSKEELAQEIERRGTASRFGRGTSRPTRR